jgi:hypothetical protein
MPNAMRADLIEESRVWYFVPILIVASILSLWILCTPILRDAAVGALRDPTRSFMEGAAVAAVLVVSRFAYVMNPFYRISLLQEHSFASGPLNLWFLSFAVGGAVEEVWRACSILSLQAIEPGSILPIGITSTVFVLAHMSGIPGRTVGIREELFWELLVGIALGTLFLRLHNLIVPYIASLTFNILNLYFIRNWCVKSV